MSARLELKCIDNSISYEDEDCLDIQFRMNHIDYCIKISSKDSHIELFVIKDDEEYRLTSLYVSKDKYRKHDFIHDNHFLLHKNDSLTKEEMDKAIEIIQSMVNLGKKNERDY